MERLKNRTASINLFILLIELLFLSGWYDLLAVQYKFTYKQATL